jgi:hypothetical protein
LGGGPIAGYEVRYAKVLITDTNFDDPLVTSTVAYTGTPSIKGNPDSITISPLNIETDYFFAIAAVDAAGNHSAIVKTPTATRASFLVTILSGATGSTDNSGFDIDGTIDIGGPTGLQPDGFSDLILGATSAKTVYVFFGSATGYSTTPSITITGTGAPTGFGRSVANIGNVDGDFDSQLNPMDDFAISSPNDGTGKVFIFSRKNPPASWGSPPKWPSTLNDTDRTYVVSTPATVTGVIAPRGLARLGDYDGDGIDDFAISYSASTASTGAVVVVKGSSAFGSLTPDVTNSTLFNGTVTGGLFGAAVVGIGQFLGSSSRPTMLITASIAGTVYSFTGVSPPGGIASTVNADDSTVGSGPDRYGNPIGYLGPLGPSAGAITLAAVTGKYVDLHIGTAATGPFLGTPGGAPTASVRFTDSQSGNSFGVINVGSGIRGKSQAVSFIGGVADTLPDLVLAGQGDGNRLYLVSGAALTTLSGTVDISTPLSGNVPGIVQIPNKFPADWANGYTTGAVIVDSNNDKFADFAIGEFSSGKPGRVAVFY